MKILLFENERVENLYPFSVLHSSWELLTGCYTSYDRIKAIFPESQIDFIGDELIVNSFKKRLGLSEISKDNQTKYLYIDASLIPIENGLEEIKKLEENSVYYYKDRPVAINSDKEIDIASIDKLDYKSKSLDIENYIYINYLHDAIEANGTILKSDLGYFHRYFNSSNINIGQNVVIDETEGRVVLDEGVILGHNSVIIGPCYIGKNTKINPLSLIHENNSFGPTCKIGGEVEGTIIQGYSNKQHQGFLGHSHIGEWVNLGADTNNSDLKNTYDTISIKLREQPIETGSQFFGSLIGDHVKTAINTQLNTGTVIGIHSMIATNGFPSTDIRSYNWTGSKQKIIYRLKKALEAAEKMMERRGKELNEYEIELMSKEYERVKPYYYS